MALASQPAAQEGEGPLRFLRPALGEDARSVPSLPAEQAFPGPGTPSLVESGSDSAIELRSLPDDAPGPVAPAGPEETLAPDPAAEPAGTTTERGETAGSSRLRIGVIGGPDLFQTMAAIAPAEEGMSKALGRPVEILPMSSYGAMIDAQVQRRIDGGFFSASAFALAEAHCSCLEPLAAPAAADGTLAYHAVVVVRNGAGIASAADLEGRSVAAAADDSIGGRRMQLAGLMSEGVEPARFAGLEQVASSEDAVRAMLMGRADAAFAWSSLAGDAAAGYSRGTFTGLVARGELVMSDIAIVWRSPPIAHGPFAVLASLDGADKARLEAYLVALDDDLPAAYDALSPYYGGGFMAVEPADYSGLELLAAQDVDAIDWPAASQSDGPPGD